MKKAIILILTTSLIYGCGNSNDADRQDALPLATEVIDTAISEGELHFAVAAVGNTTGQLWSHSAGHRDAQKTSVAANDNIIQMASMTKLITTIGALQLVEQGVLDLDTPITAYVPQLSELQVLKGFDEQDNPILENANRAPTARELMTHTGGYVYEFWNANAKKAGELGVSESLFSGGNYLAAPLAFEAGTAWEYGINTDWLGVIIERISGQRLSVYFDENIFGPLRMVDTFYELPQEKMNRSVTVMARVNEALIELPSLQPAPMAKGSMAHYSGGGGLYSTVADYGRVLQMLLNDGVLDGETLLNPETVNSMFKNNIGDIQLAALGTVMPEVSNTADLSFGNPATFGLGLLLHSEGVEGGRKAYSGSWAGLFNSYYWVDRESQTYGIFGTQILPFFDAASVNTLLKLEQAVYAQNPE
ncbi:beta-lactamase family protein [Luminiphilus sp.]|nr:beta-lactamase family protein [Luminiphilus sp.]